MTARILYFAYGSNLLPGRLRARVPSARVVGTGRVAARVLRFHKIGTDGSGKCDCPATGDPRDRVWGAVYVMDAVDKPALDAAEGPGYGQIEVSVRLGLSPVTAYTYVALEGHVGSGNPPFGWYKALVLEGARHHGFEASVLRRIRSISSVPDPDRRRAERHWKLIAGE